jgi:cystathionine beta-lyase/cystathionine gamma-synthase
MHDCIEGFFTMDKAKQQHQSLATLCIHGGQQFDTHTGAIMQPIVLATTFAQHGIGEPYPGGFEYSRTNSPTRAAFESCIAALEGGVHCCGKFKEFASVVVID